MAEIVGVVSVPRVITDTVEEGKCEECGGKLGVRKYGVLCRLCLEAGKEDVYRHEACQQEHFKTHFAGKLI